MKLDFLHTVPYVCVRWAEVARQTPDAPFLTEETSGISYSRRQADDLSARVYGYLKRKGIGAESFVLIRLPRDARPFIAIAGRMEGGGCLYRGGKHLCARSGSRPLKGTAIAAW